MSPIFKGLNSGYSPQQILQYLMKSIPQMAPTIQKAMKAGYPAQQILGFLSKSFETEDKSGMSESQIHASNTRADAERTKFGLKAAATAVAAPVVAGAVGNALSRALPTNLRNMFGLGTPGNGPQPGGAPPSHPSNIPSTPNAPNQTGTALPPTQGTIQAPGQLSNVSSQPPISTTIPQAPNIQPPQIKHIDLGPVFTKYPGIKQKIDDLRNSGNDTVSISEYFRKFNANQTAKLEKEFGQPIDSIVDEYFRTNPFKVTTKRDLQKNAEATTNQPQVSAPVEPPIQKLDKIEEVERKPIEKSQTVASPQGVGEIKEIRGDKALIEVDGKLHKVNVDELEQEPEDLEDAVRDILSKIPEGEKSTALQSAIHVNLPEGKNLTLMKFYDGKVAWYLDVPEDTYKSIALGTYEPKTKGKTGIGEYKPGVIDSRGAGFTEEIRNNPLYSKENKGKTWGYAFNEYDALNKIQPILNKISKEKYDEEGNLIQPKKKRKKPT